MSKLFVMGLIALYYCSDAIEYDAAAPPGVLGMYRMVEKDWLTMVIAYGNVLANRQGLQAWGRITRIDGPSAQGNHLVPVLCSNSSSEALTANEALTKKERVRGLLTIHEAAKQHFVGFNRVPHLDWDRAFVEYLPLVEQDQRLDEYYRVLQRFVALLEDGHTSVRLPDEVQKSFDLLPFQLEYIEGQWIIIQRYPVQEILQEDVPVGSALTSIDGTPPTAYFQERVYPYISAGTEHLKRSSINWAARFPRNASISVELRYPNGTLRCRMLRANRSTATWSDVLRETFIPREQQSLFSFKYLPDQILRVRYGLCDSRCDEQFTALIESIKGCWQRALILDLRDNPGGDTPHRLIGHLLSRPTKVCQRKTRCSISDLEAQLQVAKNRGASEKSVSDAIQQAVERGDLPKGYSPGWIVSEGILEPETTHYDGPLYVLVNGQTASAAEDVAAMLQGCGRATIIGTATAGSTGNSVHFGLPGGGDVRICAVRIQYADGRDFVPLGVRPDVPVKRTIAGIINGQDQALQAALDLAQQNLRTRETKQ